MARWSVYRWSENPGQQDGRCLYAGPDEKRARADFTNHATNMRAGASVRLYQDGRCVDEAGVFTQSEYAALAGRRSGATFLSTERRR